MEDEKILELLFARSEEAIKALAEKYGTRCRKLAGSILGNDRDAEECVNDAYLGIWNTVPPKRPNSLSAYLLGIVRNCSTTRYHTNTAKKRNSFYDAALDELEECIPSGNGVEDVILAGELARLLNSFLETLKKEDRILFVCRYWYSDSVLELAKQFGMSSNRISVRLFRIRDRLRRFLQKEGYVL
ncbi:MAG: sigma-70 family RNA polymerase sigma factor [Lachnospiraceae bacterium]|nr:sigma-70 family RNA polymerase sigma factor [Lachnospiraceae bacterium]